MPTDIAWPSVLPPLLAQQHIVEPVDVAEPAEFEVGELRLRPLYRSVPQVLQAQARLTQPQFDQFHAWHEDVLRAGTLPFDVRVAAQGGLAPVWHTAHLLAPYVARALPGGRWLVSLQLLCVGEPFATRVEATLRGVAMLGLTTRARLAPRTDLSARVQIAVTTRATLIYADMLLRAAPSIALTARATLSGGVDSPALVDAQSEQWMRLDASGVSAAIGADEIDVLPASFMEI